VPDQTILSISRLLTGVLPGNHSLVVGREGVLRFPCLFVEFLVGHTVRDERVLVFVKVEDAARVVGKRVVKFLVYGLSMHNDFSTNNLNHLVGDSSLQTFI